MSEELLQKDLIENPEIIGRWNFYNIGATTLKVLRQHKIIPNVKCGVIDRRKPDAIIAKDRKVIAVISYKLPKNLKTKKQIDKEISDWIEVTKKLKSKLLIVSDTKKTIWINALTGKIILDENGNELTHVFNQKDIESIKLIEKIIDNIDEKSSQLIPRQLKDPSSLAKQVWQDIWSVSGATPENCLYTFVELFIFKYLSDLNVLTGFYNFYDLLKKYEDNTDEQVLEFYAETIRKEIKNKFKENPKDKTTIINGTIFVSKDDKAVEGYSSVFRKVLEKFKNEGKLENIHHDFKSKIFESFLKESISKKNWGQFFTPLKVVRAVVSMVDIKEGMNICDPACGVGKFLLEPILKEINRFYKVDKTGTLKRNIALSGFDKGFDKDEQKTIILAKANMLIYLSDLIKDNPTITEQFSNLFNDTFLLKTNSILGTLSDPSVEKYDLILTNPPYVTSGSSNIKEEIVKSGLENHYTVSGLGVEGLFMEWIVRALKPNGKAFVVVPDGILSRTNDKNLRKFILDECFIDAIISLPEKTFFTTIKKTYILALTKKANKSTSQTEQIFTYLVSDIGETLDVYRFDTKINHLEDAVILFRQFIASKNHFKSADTRCKVQPLNKFKPENHWAIDRWWTEKEKIELGILEKENNISISDFGDFIGEIANELLEYQISVKELAGKKKNFPKFKEVKLNNTNYFNLFIGKRVVKRDLVKIQGTIPLYSANVFKPVGLLNKSNITDFKEDFILWGIDGDFEFAHIERGKVIATTDHCGVIRIKNDKILPSYLLIQLNEVKNKYGYDRVLRASLKNMKDIAVNIPVDSDGEFDLSTQKEIASKVRVIEQTKRDLEIKLKGLLNVNVALV
jgi:type I restriction-modification system DNA methylase subunit